jgi:hypothetical protein
MQFGNHWDFQPLSGGPLQHRLNAGFELQRTDASFERAKNTYLYWRATRSTVVDCQGDTETCADGEQYFTRRYVYSSGLSKVRGYEGSIYLEDNAKWGDVELRPGARLSYDDYTGNSNVAPRFSAAWDLFGGKSTVLHAGLNRYYGKVLYTDALRTAVQPVITETRSLVGTTLGTWTFSTQSNTLNSSADLDTPYSDEVSAGIDQALCGGRLKLDYVHRKGHDEIASELSAVQSDGKRYRTFNNNGRSRYESYRLSWQRQWRRGELLLNLTRAESETSAESYNTLLDDTALDRRIWYDGEVLSKDEVPRSDYNRTWTGNFTWLQRLPAGFDFTNVTTYRSGYRAIEDTGSNLTLNSGMPDEEEVDVYAEIKHGQAWVFDWKLGWSAPRLAGAEIRLVAEVLNVFNSKVELGENSDRYETGRQFWAGIEGRY